MLNTRISRLCVFVAVIAATAALPAAAQWKWKDSRGQTQYSDTPPPASVPERDILLRPNAAALRPVAVSTTSAPAPAASAAPADNELDAKKRQADQQEAARKRAEEEKIAQARADNCLRARTYLRSLDDGLRIARSNEKGEREILDDKGRAEESQRARQIVATDCK